MPWEGPGPPAGGGGNGADARCYALRRSSLYASRAATELGWLGRSMRACFASSATVSGEKERSILNAL